MTKEGLPRPTLLFIKNQTQENAGNRKSKKTTDSELQKGPRACRNPEKAGAAAGDIPTPKQSPA